MTAFETHAHIGPDGTLTLRLPPGFEGADVRVTISRDPVSNGNGGRVPPTVPRRPVTEAEWKVFVDRTAGSVPDFPDVERPGPDSYEQRDDLQ